MHICELAHRRIETYVGESIPNSSREVWMSGREGKNYQNLERFIPKTLSAVEYLVERVSSSPNSIDIIAIGPLTNIARAIQSSSDFESNVKQIWIMGGDFTQSRVEHNFKCDVDSARIVMQSRAPISILDLPSSQKTILGMNEIKRIRSAPKLGELLHAEILSWIQPRNQDWTIPHDPIAALALLEPQFFQTTRDGLVTIDKDGYSFWNESHLGNVRLLNPINPEMAVNAMVDLITNYSKV